MVNKHISDLMDGLKTDLEHRYNIKCRFRENCVGTDKIELIIFLEGVSGSWYFVYYLDLYDLLTKYSYVLGDIIIKLENEWMNMLYRK